MLKRADNIHDIKKIAEQNNGRVEYLEIFSKKIPTDITYHHCVFKKTISCNVTNQDLIRFYHCKFLELRIKLNNSRLVLDNCTFFKKTNILVSHSNLEINYTETKAIFNIVLFDAILTIYLCFMKNLSIAGDSSIESSEQKPKESSENNNIELSQIHISNYLKILRVKNLSLNINTLLVEKFLFAENNIIIANRMTYNFIKSHCIVANDKISAIEYHKYEMKAYREELIKDDEKKPNDIWDWIVIIVTFRLVTQYIPYWWKRLFEKKIEKKERKKIEGKKRWDRFILMLDRISTEHGTNPKRGIYFTVLWVWIPTYIIYIFVSCHSYPYSLDWDGGATGEAITYFFRGMFVYFIPTHKIDFMQDFSVNGGSYCIDFVGRILISYGVYQTIMAFRKFNR